MDATLHLPTRTRDWLAEHPQARQFVRGVWDKLTELERSGQYPGAIDALRRVLTHHQPTSAGRCRTCARIRGRRRPFPCIVWHQIHCDLLGLFADTGRHRQPIEQDSYPGPNMSGTPDDPPSRSSPTRPEPIWTTQIAAAPGRGRRHGQDE